MANYYATARSNYFRPKDRNALIADLDGLYIDVVDELPDGSTGRVALLCNDPDASGWPEYRYDKENDMDLEISVPEIVRTHLADGEIAYGLEVGAEKQRYLLGLAWATDGTTIINLDLEEQIRMDIQNAFDVDDMAAVPAATY